MWLKLALKKLEGIKDFFAKTQQCAAQPVSHKKKGNTYSNKFHTKGERLLLELGYGLEKAKYDAHNGCYHNWWQRQLHHKEQTSAYMQEKRLQMQFGKMELKDQGYSHIMK